MEEVSSFTVKIHKFYYNLHPIFNRTCMYFLFSVLASWFRLKYPHVALGALASSAPILYFDDITPQDGYYTVVTKDFRVRCWKFTSLSFYVGLYVLRQKYVNCRVSVKLAMKLLRNRGQRLKQLLLSQTVCPFWTKSSKHAGNILCLLSKIQWSYTSLYLTSVCFHFVFLSSPLPLF